MIVDVVVVGAGAAGLMCALQAGKRGRRVVVLDKANKVGKKILMSGGGRCNFTNYYIEPEKYLSHNRHFCKSALSRYTQWDFIALVEKHGIEYYEKTLGQLFCCDKSSQIVKMLVKENEQHQVAIHLNQTINQLKQVEGGFFIKTNQFNIKAQSVVIASGGLSIPTMGASPFGYQVAEQFGLKVYPTRAGLVPFTLQPEDKARFEPLSGISLECEVSCGGISFRENLLLTHRGLSGPAMLQISSYWQAGDTLTIKLLPQHDINDLLSEAKLGQPEQQVKTVLGQLLPKRVLSALIDSTYLAMPCKQLSHKQIDTISQALQSWQIKPNGTEGYRTAEVTLGGVDCDEVSSKTFASRKVPNLYFIGEVLDVTGWLGGYNFQWAWSSGWAAGQVV